MRSLALLLFHFFSLSLLNTALGLLQSSCKLHTHTYVYESVPLESCRFKIRNKTTFSKPNFKERSSISFLDSQLRYSTISTGQFSQSLLYFVSLYSLGRRLWLPSLFLHTCTELPISLRRPSLPGGHACLAIAWEGTCCLSLWSDLLACFCVPQLQFRVYPVRVCVSGIEFVKQKLAASKRKQNSEISPCYFTALVTKTDSKQCGLLEKTRGLSHFRGEEASSIF